MTRRPLPDPAARDRLRAAGLRVTGVRLKVIDALAASAAPLNAQEVADRLASIGEKLDRVTLYRTLNSFVDAGIAHRVDPGDRVFRFSLTAPAEQAGGAVHAHPHFVCDACGTVQCLEDAEVLIRPKEAAAAPSARKRAPMRVTQQDAVLHGTCGDCTTPRSRPRR